MGYKSSKKRTIWYAFFMNNLPLFVKYLSMEGIPKNNVPASERESNIENLADWRELRDRAPEKVTQLIQDIPEFEAMESGEQIIALQTLQEDLAGDNKNRFMDGVIASEIANRLDVMDDVDRSEYKLPLRTPAERVEVKSNPVPEVPEYPLSYLPKAGDGITVGQVAELAPGVQKHAA